MIMIQVSIKLIGRRKLMIKPKGIGPKGLRHRGNNIEEPPINIIIIMSKGID